MARRNDMHWLLVGFLTFVSLGLRLTVVAQEPFPINDGGLFHVFINDIVHHGMRLPAYSSYNSANIPLVYPPLGLYSTAVIHVASGISTLALIQYLPAVLSAACIPVFFILAVDVLKSRSQALVATLAFALIPRTSDWLIMGGGITRSFGLLFALAFLVQANRLFARQEPQATVPAVIFGGLVVLSHPEAAVHAALTAVLMLAWHARSRYGVARAAIVVLGVAAFTAPWWTTILINHTAAPWMAGIRAAQQDSYDPLLGAVGLLRFDFTDEPFLRLFGVLGLLGFVLLLSRRMYFLVGWFILLHLVEPRGGALFMMIPLAMAAGFFLDEVLLPSLEQPATQTGSAAPDRRQSAAQARGSAPPSGAATGLLVFLFLYGCFASYIVGMRLREEASLARRDLAALDWIAHNTAPAARFALVTGGDPLLDPTADWFPAITERRNVASFFGSEWIPGADFGSSLQRYRELQRCAGLSSACLKEWAGVSIDEINYVYVRGAAEGDRTPLQASLGLDPTFMQIYAEGGIELYEWMGTGAN